MKKILYSIAAMTFVFCLMLSSGVSQAADTDKGNMPMGTGMPMDKGTMPMDKGTMPMDKGTMPMDKGTMPMDKGMMTDKGTMPMDNGKVMMDNGHGQDMMKNDEKMDKKNMKPVTK